MALLTKPDMQQVWASGGDIVEPSDLKKQQGWTVEVPPHQFENWIQNRQDEYLAHINQRGIPGWDGNTEYEAGGLSYVQGSNGVVYKSVAASGPTTTVQDPINDATATYWTLAFSTVEPSPSALNTKLIISTPSASATVTAEEIIFAKSLGGITYKVSNYSKVINLGTVGVGGMDTGLAPANGYVAIYAIYNPTTNVSALLAKDATSGVQTEIYNGLNMPVGYTASALLTVLATNASRQFKQCAVFDRKVYILLGTAFSGASINANVSISGIVPANAKSILSGEMALQNTANSSMSLTVSSSLALSVGQQNVTSLIGAGGALLTNFSNVPLVTPQSVGLVGSSSAGTATYTLYISGYEL